MTVLSWLVAATALLSTATPQAAVVAPSDTLVAFARLACMADATLGALHGQHVFEHGDVLSNGDSLAMRSMTYERRGVVSGAVLLKRGVDSAYVGSASITPRGGKVVLWGRGRVRTISVRREGGTRLLFCDTDGDWSWDLVALEEANGRRYEWDPAGRVLAVLGMNRSRPEAYVGFVDSTMQVRWMAFRKSDEKWSVFGADSNGAIGVVGIGSGTTLEDLRVGRWMLFNDEQAVALGNGGARALRLPREWVVAKEKRAAVLTDSRMRRLQSMAGQLDVMVRLWVLPNTHARHKF